MDYLDFPNEHQPQTPSSYSKDSETNFIHDLFKGKHFCFFCFIFYNIVHLKLNLFNTEDLIGYEYTQTGPVAQKVLQTDIDNDGESKIFLLITKFKQS